MKTIALENHATEVHIYNIIVRMHNEFHCILNFVIYTSQNF